MNTEATYSQLTDADIHIGGHYFFYYDDTDEYLHWQDKEVEIVECVQFNSRNYWKPRLTSTGEYASSHYIAECFSPIKQLVLF